MVIGNLGTHSLVLHRLHLLLALYHHCSQWGRERLFQELAITIYRESIEGQVVDLAFIYRSIIGRKAGSIVGIGAAAAEHGWYQHVQVA